MVASFSIRQVFFAGKQPERDIPDRTQIVGYIVASGAVPSCQPERETAVFIQEGGGDTVDFVL